MQYKALPENGGALFFVQYFCTMNISSLYSLFLQNPSVQTDTRKLQPGDIFFALKGDQFNGNLFARQALEQGAAWAVIDEDVQPLHERFVRVPNALETLQQLAGFHRSQFNIPFIAITGSNGKTTTKELINAVLSKKYSVSTTVGNLNNHIGIPLTLLRVPRDAEMAVIEMGANHQKEIEGYCKYTRPTHGLITNVGKAHLEGFGGEDGVKKGKGELYDFLRAHEGTAFVMWDYPYLQKMSRGIPHIVTYGTHHAQVTGTVNRSEPFLEVQIGEGDAAFNIHSQLVGDYNLPNILAAACVARHFKITDEDIQSAIAAYTPSNSRSQLMKKGSNKIILDAYNANPSSMKAAIENFAKLDGEKKILLLGGMMELGNESVAEHREIVSLIERYAWQQVALVGGDFLHISHPFLQFNDSTEARDWLASHPPQHATILIKGSRSMKMENLLDAIS